MLIFYYNTFIMMVRVSIMIEYSRITIRVARGIIYIKRVTNIRKLFILLLHFN